ncbi:hypothetical protein D0C36_14180 [Mucilaginibacter conchicola]|uniref:DUF4843 domain-containing protein n=1 Tax=Mucilaginibacter conchicola TaxID=2303333 RepID=A0A372NU72_9SPHI|nr:hypothetical protein [Mucilaginibacter conchicola]RFZ92564.1 hypothetical protein D0C36_14180 [Mucilaginibacter conchicola]
MKKKLTLFVATIAILFTACSKDGADPVISDSGWFFNGVAHFVVTSARTEPTGTAAGKIVFRDSNKDRNATLTVYFKAIPQTAGVYNLVQGVGAGLAANEIAVSATQQATSSNVAYAGAAGVKVQVSITDAGKIKVDIPEITLTSTSGTDTYKLSAFASER